MFIQRYSGIGFLLVCAVFGICKSCTFISSSSIHSRLSSAMIAASSSSRCCRAAIRIGLSCYETSMDAVFMLFFLNLIFVAKYSPHSLHILELNSGCKDGQYKLLGKTLAF